MMENEAKNVLFSVADARCEFVAWRSFTVKAQGSLYSVNILGSR